MATIVKEFNYTGTLKIGKLPAGVSSMDIYLWGGAGGSGGSDYSGDGSDGAAGHYIEAKGINTSAYAGRKNIVIAVGGAGGSGSTGSNAKGGINGKSMTGYSGGTGGSSGSAGSSGSGGGGGGATLVTLFESGESLDNIVLGIAGGGGGAGGSGYQSRGGAGINTNTATSVSPDTLGENGAGHSGDGGGGAGAGGGAKGGKGGSGATGDAGGFGGNSGSNTIPGIGAGTGLATSATELNGSGRVPGKTNLTLTGSQFGSFNGQQLYTNSRAYGGEKSGAGRDGRAIVVFHIPAQANYKVGGAWKEIKDIQYKSSGVWGKIIAGYYKVGGVWKAFWSTDINFDSVAAGFGNPTGNTTSGSTGAGGVVTAVTVPDNAPPSDRGGDGGDNRVVPEPPRVCFAPTWTPAADPFSRNDNSGNDTNSRVICTELHRTGELSTKDWIRDTQFTFKNLTRKHVKGYLTWAIPTVKLIKKYPTYRKLWKHLAQHRANDVAWRLGEGKFDLLGRIYSGFGEPLCWLIGNFVSDKQIDELNAFSSWRKA